MLWVLIFARLALLAVSILSNVGDFTTRRTYLMILRRPCVRLFVYVGPWLFAVLGLRLLSNKTVRGIPTWLWLWEHELDTHVFLPSLSAR